MIRNATLEDLTDIAVTGWEMHQESRFSKFPYDVEKVIELASRLIESERGICLLYEKDGVLIGGFMGEVVEHYFGRSLAAYDYALFILPQFRGGTAAMRLIKEFVKQAVEKGAQEVVIANSTGVDSEMVEKLYKKLKFTRVGGVYVYEG